jgi:hypothetical protein
LNNGTDAGGGGGEAEVGDGAVVEDREITAGRRRETVEKRGETESGGERHGVARIRV